MEPTQAELDAFIKRAGFSYGWENLESWGRRMAEQAVREINEAAGAERARIEQVLACEVECSVYENTVLPAIRACAERTPQPADDKAPPSKCEHPVDQLVEWHVGHDEWEWSCKACGRGGYFSAEEGYTPVQDRAQSTPQPADRASGQS